MDLLKEKFIKYYLPNLIIFIIGMMALGMVISLFRWLAGEKVFLIQSIIPILTIAIVLSLLIGGLIHFSNEFLIPRKNKKVVGNKNFNFLVNMGFEYDSESFKYSGYYKSYYLVILGGCTINMDAIRVSAFIYPEENEEDNLLEFKNLYELALIDNLCLLTLIIPLKGLILSEEKFTKEVNEFIANLIQQNIKPIKVED